MYCREDLGQLKKKAVTRVAEARRPRGQSRTALGAHGHGVRAGMSLTEWSGQSCLAFWFSLFSWNVGLFRRATLNNRADLMGGGHPGLRLLGL